MILELRWVKEDPATGCDIIGYRTEASLSEAEADIEILSNDPNVKKIQFISTETIYERGKE